jgi:hypothetical protein
LERRALEKLVGLENRHELETTAPKGRTKLRIGERPSAKKLTGKTVGRGAGKTYTKTPEKVYGKTAPKAPAKPFGKRS